MKIYFAGSIRGGRLDVTVYEEFISHLGKWGTVLTRHVGDCEILSDGEKDLSDSQIYWRDIEWLKAADVVIAEVSTPSLGVGYEIGFAEFLHQPILCLIAVNRRDGLSAMVAGNPAVSLREYSSLQEANILMDEFLSRIAGR
jgi:2'-deoxynucleoside 5'-phosphate N-hydrolase